MFNPKQLITVLANNPKTEDAKDNKTVVILAKAPIASMIPPKTIADRINNIVQSIPIIPLELNKSFSCVLSVIIDVSVKIELDNDVTVEFPMVSRI